MTHNVKNPAQQEEDEQDDFEGSIYKVVERRNGKPAMVSMTIADIPVEMELETGSSTCVCLTMQRV